MQSRLVMWVVGLLVAIGAAAPALACTADLDCCPSGTQMPCDDEESGMDPDSFAMLCCASAPGTSSATVTDVRRPAAVQPQRSASPDPVATLAWLATLIAAAAPPVPIPIPSDAVAADSRAALTWLHTLRLRL